MAAAQKHAVLVVTSQHSVERLTIRLRKEERGKNEIKADEKTERKRRRRERVETGTSKDEAGREGRGRGKDKSRGERQGE